jgi:hypothetical protein
MPSALAMVSTGRPLIGGGRSPDGKSDAPFSLGIASGYGVLRPEGLAPLRGQRMNAVGHKSTRASSHYLGLNGAPDPGIPIIPRG